MFAWIGKRVSTPWSRRTRWTPLLHNQRELQRILSKERSRVDRDGSCFGFIILRLSDLSQVRPETVRLAKLLHRRLRDTDEKGHLGYGRLGIMLPATGPMASEYVLEDVLRLAAKAKIGVEGEVFVYPEQDTPSDSDQRPSDREYSGEAGELVAAQTGEAGTDGIASNPLAMMLPKYPTWKRGLDIVGASIGLVLSAPVLLAAAVAVKLTSPGPVLFCQRRTGYLGRTFTIYKLRTMVNDAAEMQASLARKNERDGPVFKMRRDPRTTRLGRFLRATGLDELPQLFNVLIGDMSLVGPRPLPVAEASQCLPWQKRRQEVKPGVTCFWQIAKSRKIAFIDWMRLDLEYARRASFSLDIRLIARTFLSVFLGRVGH